MLLSRAKVPRTAHTKTYKVNDLQGVIWYGCQRRIVHRDKLPWFENFARPKHLLHTITPYFFRTSGILFIYQHHTYRTDWTAKGDDAQALLFKVTERSDLGLGVL